jgi:two-component system cell cycle response regulator
MNSSTPVEQAPNRSRRFILEMIGFTDAEKSMLSSTFRLTGRRAFCYAELTDEDPRADIYLINADNSVALETMQAHAPNVHSPAVLVGREPVDVGWPFVQKPIHWMRLFEHLDSVMQNALLERSKRERNTDTHWDGSTFRRSIDKKSPEEPVFMPKKPTESVLVVDDSATVRAFMRIKLTPFNFDVDYAENGEQAIDMAQAKTYTCIFLDIMMPGIDGYEVCKRIKTNPDTKETAVVMLTSKSSMFDKFRGNWSGCDAYLSKPVAEDELLATIAKFLPSSRA